jgi:hypothetical protein
MALARVGESLSPDLFAGQSFEFVRMALDLNLRVPCRLTPQSSEHSPSDFRRTEEQLSLVRYHLVLPLSSALLTIRGLHQSGYGICF